MRGGGARLVSAGIGLSRLTGLVRQRLTAHYLGSSEVADALAAAFRIPNLFQNLLGEGSLSASFIPVYGRLLAEKRFEDAGRVAGGVFAALSLLVAVLVALGVLVAPWLVALVAPGFAGETRTLTVLLVRILFPGIGILVLSAWCLGVLNAHRRLFLSYVSPVVWNGAIIVALVSGGDRAALTGLSDIAVLVAMGSVVGAVLQFVVQVPTVLRVERSLRLRPGESLGQVVSVLEGFGPAVASRGAAQLSAYLDTMIASLLGAGALATLGYAQVLAMLPISLFGMSNAVVALVDMSGSTGDDESRRTAYRGDAERGLARTAYFVIPSLVAFVVIGDSIVSALFQGGVFTAEDARWVWVALAGSSVGLLPTTLGRVYASASFALRDTRTPLRYASIRYALAAALGLGLALTLPGALEIDPRWGVGILTAGSGVAAWVECRLLRQYVSRRLGTVQLPPRLLVQLWSCAAIAAGAGWWSGQWSQASHPLVRGGVACLTFGLTYLALTRFTGADRARRA
jgi:putative peptidoglycan lipid II flippase